jgi:hypothetical protein
MINIRKLAAVDMAWLGTKIIVTEYALGIALPLALGLLSIRAGLIRQVVVGWEAALGVWLVFIGLNYIPLFIYAVLIAKARSAREEGQTEFVHAKRYGIQQVIILVPLLVVILALLQESRRHPKQG